MGRARGRLRRDWRVVVDEAFRRDASAQVSWLRSQDRAAWIATLKQSLVQARDLLSGTPFVAPADERGVRRLLVHRVPFILWYRVEAESGMVRWLRLFHAKQRSAR